MGKIFMRWALSDYTSLRLLGRLVPVAGEGIADARHE